MGVGGAGSHNNNPHRAPAPTRGAAWESESPGASVSMGEKGDEGRSGTTRPVGDRGTEGCAVLPGKESPPPSHSTVV